MRRSEEAGKGIDEPARIGRRKGEEAEMGTDGSQIREFRMVLEAKEREIFNLCDQQIQSLHSQIREKENVVSDLKAELLQLQDDFKYNLSLLDARDAELVQYDATTPALEASVVENEDRIKVACKALAEANTLRLQEKARAEELEQLTQKKISELEKESLAEQMESMRESKEELQGKSKQELESSRNELKGLLTKKEEEIQKHKRELEEMESKAELWSKKVADMEVQVAETAIKLQSAEKNVQAAEASLIQHRRAFTCSLNDKSSSSKGRVLSTIERQEKELEAACASHKKDIYAASQREEQLLERERELGAQIDKQDKEKKALAEQLRQLEEEKKGWEKATERETRDLNERLEVMKSHHNTAVDQLKEELDSLRIKWQVAEAKRLDQFAEFAEKTRATEAETGRLRKELQEKDQEQKELEEKHAGLRNRYSDLQKELAVYRPYEQMAPQGVGPTEGGNGSSSSLPAASPLMSPGFLHDEVLRMDQGKRLQLESENSQLRARCEDLSLQNDRIREVVGNMRLEMEALQSRTSGDANQTKSQPTSPSKSAGLQHLQVEVQYLKQLIQGMAEELGGLRSGSPVHSRRSPQRGQTGRSVSPKRSGGAAIRRQQSPEKSRSLSRPRSPVSSPTHTSPQNSKHAIKGDQASKVAELELIQRSLRAQLEATSVDMTRIANERDLLMELSNSLRADLTKILQATGAGDYQASIFGQDARVVYGGPPPSMPSQKMEVDGKVKPKLLEELQREIVDSGQIPRNAKLMTGMSTSSDVAHARPRTTAPHTTRFAPYPTPTDTSSKQRSYGLAQGPRVIPEITRLQMEGTPYLSERPQGSDNDALHKGTASQHSRFKAAMKRKECLSKPIIRNWNIKSDNPLDT